MWYSHSYGAPFVSQRMFPVSIRSCRTRATNLFSRRRTLFTCPCLCRLPLARGQIMYLVAPGQAAESRLSLHKNLPCSAPPLVVGLVTGMSLSARGPAMPPAADARTVAPCAIDSERPAPAPGTPAAATKIPDEH